MIIICVGYGKDEVPNIIWKNGDDILPSESSETSQLEVNNETLMPEINSVFIESIVILCDVRSDDAGNYSCTANNSYGSTSSDFSLNIKPNRKRITFLVVKQDLM